MVFEGPYGPYGLLWKYMKRGLLWTNMTGLASDKGSGVCLECTCSKVCFDSTRSWVCFG